MGIEKKKGFPFKTQSRCFEESRLKAVDSIDQLWPKKYSDIHIIQQYSTINL